jgi:ring-1,2-phenylacetyl-CoA epoxidase subunit PaaD
VVTAIQGSQRLTAARRILQEIKDPEIPGVDIVEMGMIHDVREVGDTLVVEVIPTFSGCPAIGVILDTIGAGLESAGLGPVQVNTRADIPWSTEMITERGRRQVEAFGIVPPQRKLVAEEITCLNCHERNVALVSRFGATPCRATARCRSCGEPLEVFKPVGVTGP